MSPCPVVHRSVSAPSLTTSVRLVDMFKGILPAVLVLCIGVRPVHHGGSLTTTDTITRDTIPLPDPSSLPPDGGPDFNRLVFTTSPYLHQHARDPVDWHPWSEEAFALARREDRPVFLSIGYSTCHWCHVMQHESFQDAAVADLLNRRFVSIKLDREERPDLDHIYMQVCQALTGTGGWPLTLFLTPDRRPFVAGTYFPRESRHGRPGFLQLCEAVDELWRTKREKVMETAGGLTAMLNRIEPAADAMPGGDAVDAALTALRAGYDAAHGGFGAAPKFPSPHILLLLMQMHERGAGADALRMADATLKAMHRGGIWDQIGFGYSRYATDRRWLIPHFEKMLYDNAMLLLAHAEAFRLTRDAGHRDAALGIVSYVRRVLRSPGGLFLSAENADSEGVEGRFHVFTHDEFCSAVGAEHAAKLCEWFGVSPEGNFEHGTNILHRSMELEAWAARHGLPTSDAAHIIEAARTALFARRSTRIHPSLDHKTQVSWNGLMITGLARAGFVFGDDSLVALAADAASAILRELITADGTLLHCPQGGAAGVDGMLEDHAALVRGLLELHRATGDTSWLLAALRLHDTMWRRFADTVNGGLFMSTVENTDTIARLKDGYDGAVPSGNALAAWNAVMLGRLTGEDEYLRQAESILRAFTDQIERHPTASTALIAALDALLRPAREVVLTGDADRRAEFLAVLRRDSSLADVVLQIPVDPQDPVFDRLPMLRVHHALEPRAGVCQGQVCMAPVTTPAGLESLLGTDGRPS